MSDRVAREQIEAVLGRRVIVKLSFGTTLWGYLHQTRYDEDGWFDVLSSPSHPEIMAHYQGFEAKDVVSIREITADEEMVLAVRCTCKSTGDPKTDAEGWVRCPIHGPFAARQRETSDDD